MTNRLDQAFSPENFRQLAHQLVDQLADHLDAVQTKPETSILPYRDPGTELDFWQADFAKEEADMPGFFQDVLDHSIRLHHPHYVGHQVSVPALVAGLAGLFSDVLSNGTGVYEMGMASNALERVVTDFTAQAIGYGPEAGGLITSGGTLANLTALLAARQAKVPTAWQEGQQEKLAIMVSEEAHYCVDRAVRVMGWGEGGIIKLPVDETFKVRTDLLPEYLAKAQVDGRRVIAVVGCAASTATGSYDNLEAIADFCERHDLWFHVDGAHGGAVVFSEQYRSLVKGMERANSVVIDYHKMLLTPALNTALIYRDGQLASQTFSQRAQYLWEEQQVPEWYHSGKRTFECTKLMLSVKVYAILKAHGKGVFAENVDRLYNLARTFYRMLVADSRFEVVVAPESNIVCFRYVGGSAEHLDWLNTQLRERVVKHSNFYLVQTVINGHRYLRTTLMNPMTQEAQLRQLLELLGKEGASLVSASQLSH